MKKGRSSSRKKNLAIGVGIIAALAVAALGYLLLSGGGAKDYKFSDGSRMDGRTYAMLKSRCESNVIQHFVSVYNADTGKDFWDTEFSSGTPRQMLESEIKVGYGRGLAMFALGKEFDIIAYEDFKGFFEDLDRENVRREAAVEKGEVIYGPQHYTDFAYYDYTLSNLTRELPPLMEGKYLTADEAGMRDFYAENKDRYISEGRALVRLLTIVGDEDAGIGEPAPLEPEIEAALATGSDFDAIKERYADEVTLTDLELELKGNTITAARYPGVLEAALEMEINGISGPMDVGGLRGFVQCLEKTSGAQQSYEEAASFVRTDYLVQRFQDYLAELSG